MEITLIICLLATIILFKVFNLGNYFAPWGITAIIWFAILFFYQFQGDLLYPLSQQFYYCVAIWVPVFCISGLLTFYLLPKPDATKDYTAAASLSVNNGIFNILFWISMVLTPIYVVQIIRYAMSFDYTNLLSNLRMLAVMGDQNYGILRYTYIINQALFVIAIWKYPQIPGWKLTAVVLANVIGQLAIMEKSGMFFMVFNALFVLYEKKKISAKAIIITIILIVGLFFFFNNIMTNETEDTSRFGTFTIADFLSIYILSPATAFGRVTRDVTNQFGPHCFQVIYLLTNRLGLTEVEVNQRLQEFVWVPLPTNVYTIFRPFFQDFGYRGIAFFAFLYGTLSSWVYWLYRSGNSLGKCVYCYVIYVLVMQFYQENLLMSFFVFLQLVFFLFILTEDKMTIGFYKRENKSNV